VIEIFSQQEIDVAARPCAAEVRGPGQRDVSKLGGDHIRIIPVKQRVVHDRRAALVCVPVKALGCRMRAVLPCAVNQPHKRGAAAFVLAPSKLERLARQPLRQVLVVRPPQHDAFKAQAHAMSASLLHGVPKRVNLPAQPRRYAERLHQKRVARACMSSWSDSVVLASSAMHQPPFANVSCFDATRPLICVWRASLCSR